MNFNNHKKSILIGLTAFIIGGLCVYLYHGHSDYNFDFSQERFTDKYEFISPLLECDSFESKELNSFDEGIYESASLLMENGSIDDLSYYFRDLNNGVWVGLNEEEKFAPASLMKLPLMISYLKQSEDDLSVLKQSYTFNIEDDNYSKQNIAPEELMSIGTPYTVEELIFRMIAYSDNSALRILLKNSGTFGLRVFNDLSIELPEDQSNEDFMSVRTYSKFFRTLYNGSYLNYVNSDEALRVLSKTQYKDGIVAGVPEDIVVAHKFGERENNGVIQLHDCGIVYHPDKPYVLCIMTRGSDINKMSSAISYLSKYTYEEVDDNFK
ncbi:serine hydrolase [Candidatus Nomurabacteria bacterium]|nr:MAG: serine hydrolase [Candidatus Nomurabacteria bacterium]